MKFLNIVFMNFLKLVIFVKNLRKTLNPERVKRKNVRLIRV